MVTPTVNFNNRHVNGIYVSLTSYLHRVWWGCLVLLFDVLLIYSYHVESICHLLCYESLAVKAWFSIGATTATGCDYYYLVLP